MKDHDREGRPVYSAAGLCEASLRHQEDRAESQAAGDWRQEDHLMCLQRRQTIYAWGSNQLPLECQI